MKIIFTLPPLISNWQKAAVLEVMQHPEAEVSVWISEGNSFHKTDNKLIKFIDRRFTIFSEEAINQTSTEKFISRHGLKRIPKIEHADFIINLCSENLDLLHQTSIITPILDEESWKSSSILKNKTTSIFVKIKHLSQEDFLSELTFSTEVGMYNNRDKALFYFSYLISKTVFSGYVQKPSVKSTINSTSFQVFTYYLKRILEILKRKVYLPKFYWKLAVVKDAKIHLIEQPPKTFWADPFVCEWENNNWIFFEEYNYNKSKGEISAILLDENFKVKRKEKALVEKEHLSYPNVFIKDGSYFMMPEKSESKRLDIYKCINMPYHWELHFTLLENIKAIDTNWILHEGKYYLFFNKIENHEFENNERLYIYYANDLFTKDWVPHPQNPVIINKKASRNAGDFYRFGENIFRVNQDCSSSYGEKIYINKINKLSPENYEEEIFDERMTPKNFVGLHTLNSSEDFEIIDLLKKV